MATISDPSTLLMLRVRDGDAEAFEQLVALWQPRLVTLFLNHTVGRKKLVFKCAKMCVKISYSKCNFNA